MARGDARAFEAVYERHSGAAYSLAYRMVGTRSVAEDVTQEAFLNLWRSGAHYDRVARLGAHLDPRDRPSPRDRRAAARLGALAPALGRRDGRRAAGGARARRGGRRPPRRGGDRAQRDGHPARRPAEGHRARLLRRLHARGDRRDARGAGRHREGAHAPGSEEDARSRSRRERSDDRTITSAGKTRRAATSSTRSRTTSAPATRRISRPARTAGPRSTSCAWPPRRCRSRRRRCCRRPR